MHREVEYSGSVPGNGGLALREADPVAEMTSFTRLIAFAVTNRLHRRPSVLHQWPALRYRLGPLRSLRILRLPVQLCLTEATAILRLDVEADYLTI